MTQQIFIQTAILILLYVISLIIKSYWPKYFETKAANQATKEDIGNITRIVENIKSELLKETEELKARMSFKNQQTLNLKAAEREAIFDFNKKLHAYIYYLIRFRLSGYNSDNYKDLKREEIEISKRKYECDIADGHLMLFMHDKEFIELKTSVSISALKYERLLSTSMLKIYHIYDLCEVQLAVDPKNEYGIRENAIKSISLLLEEFNQNSIELYRIIVSNNSKLTKLIHKRVLTNEYASSGE